MTKISILLSLVIISGCVAVEKSNKQVTNIDLSSDSIHYEGRIRHDGDSSAIFYSGSGLTFRFRGTSARVWMRDETGDSYFNIVVDGDVHYVKPDTFKSAIAVSLAPLRDTIHTVSVLKRNEWANGRTWVYGLTLGDGELLQPPPAKNRTIEFFGNSITAGYAIDDNTGGDSPDSIYTNNYYTYAAITARHFNANYYCTARSGIGIMISWFPTIMPDVYDRLDPFDPESKWDFSRSQPDVVVINLLQNDSWLVKLPDHESFKQRFGTKAPTEIDIVNAYKSFVSKIRTAYPKAHIICVLGSMDATKDGSPWPGYVRRAVSEMNDDRLYSHFFPYMNKSGHPRRADNEIMAQSLIDFIKAGIWR